jgi:hypothetical protein
MAIDLQQQVKHSAVKHLPRANLLFHHVESGDGGVHG